MLESISTELQGAGSMQAHLASLQEKVGQLCARARSQMRDGKVPDAFSFEVRFPKKTHVAVPAASFEQALAFCPIQVTLDGHRVNLVAHPKSWLNGYEHKDMLSYTVDGQARAFQVTTLVPGALTPEQSQDLTAEIVPVRHGVALKSISIAAPAPGIRLIVDVGDEVQTSLDGLELTPTCQAWQARLPALKHFLISLGEKVQVGHRPPAPWWVRALTSFTLFLIYVLLRSLFWHHSRW